MDQETLTSECLSSVTQACVGAREARPDLKTLMTAESDPRHLVQAQNLAKSLPSHHQALDPAFLYDSQKQFCLDFYRPYYQK